MKILSIQDNYKDKKSDMDLLMLLVEYNGGGQGEIYLYRAQVDAIQKRLELIEKYNIPEIEIDNFIELVKSAYQADHFYDYEN